jgi:Flp pilus assembly protein TadD
MGFDLPRVETTRVVPWIGGNFLDHAQLMGVIFRVCCSVSRIILTRPIGNILLMLGVNNLRNGNGLLIAALIFSEVMVCAVHSARAGSFGAASGSNASTIDDQAALKLARAFRSAGDLRSAIPIYRTLAARKTASPLIAIELGDALLGAGLTDDAIGVFTAAAVNPQTAADAQTGLAHAQLRLNRPAEALVFANRAVAGAPRNLDAQIARGVALDRLGRHAEAADGYRAVLAVDPRSKAARTDLALSLAMAGQYAEAKTLLEPIARSSDATPRDRQNYAFIFGLAGDRATAAAVGRADLDAATVEANDRYFASVAGARR